MGDVSDTIELSISPSGVNIRAKNEAYGGNTLLKANTQVSDIQFVEIPTYQLNLHRLLSRMAAPC